jgi:hypothetical protein
MGFRVLNGKDKPSEFNLFQRIMFFHVYCILWFLMTYPLIIGCCKMRGLRPIRIEGIPIFILVWLIVLISHVILGKNTKVM